LQRPNAPFRRLMFVEQTFSFEKIKEIFVDFLDEKISFKQLF